MDTANPPAFITLRKLSKSYLEGGHQRHLFKGLSLEIEQGEFIALLGRSGSGKSTLLNLISGVDLPDAGEIIIHGTNLTQLSERQRTLFRRHHIGFVFQSYNLIPTLTVYENLMLPLELKGTLNVAERAYAQTLLQEVELAERARSYPDQLSGGEQQRLAITRALVHRPLLLLADEPTGNLDTETSQQVIDLITRLARQTAMTVIMVTHSHELASRADRILLLRDGVLVNQAAGVL